jgi:hypothetical protein
MVLEHSYPVSSYVQRLVRGVYQVSLFFIFGFEGEQIQKRTRDALSCSILFFFSHSSETQTPIELATEL